ncbi:hypothetical protein [Rivibacter subsaxonicus]|uniref:Uncharacterized protein n=1 Tax=Rivibacter subsaxonicus TaxID=457575 RepID=A0A4Q7VWU2_9BURK|nr:hypothetical protein [Rivibacter subsaxonicus]RZU00918.1 hypothetical protein EV670_1631 [Rivibacter subsaxonicus]
MSSITKPKRALLAYCALADRIHQSNAGMFGALVPFFAPICREFAGRMFDAAAFSNAVASLYGMRIPRLAVLGMAEQLEGQGLLVPVVGKARGTVYQYAAVSVGEDAPEVPGVTEREIDSVLHQFVESCRADPLFTDETEQRLQEEFLDRLLNAESMRLLARKEASVAAKASSKTLALRRAESDPKEQRGLRLDFHAAQFLVDLRDSQPTLFDRVSDIAFASMAAEALACFSEPAVDKKDLGGLEIYLDSPLLLDVLGVNVDYSVYGTELLAMVSSSGAQPAVFDDCIVEAESVVSGQLASLRSGNSRIGYFGASAKPHVLSALKGNIGSRAAAVGISVKQDPQLDLMRRSKNTVGDIQAELSRRMAHWPNDEARTHDERSVWALLRIRDANTLCTRICDSKAVFITRNTALAQAANDAWRTWLTAAAKQSVNAANRWAPVALSDKQLAGYLWLRSGEGNGQMSRARLLAHCSAAIRPRPDVKARAYNLVLDLHGKAEADHVAALLEDREGERALMRATRADPEDVTPERLPYIIEQVKLAAGEFAAAVAREEAEQKLIAQKEEGEQQLTALQVAHEEQLARIASDNAKAQKENAKGVEKLHAELAQRDHESTQLEGRVDALSQQLLSRERSDLAEQLHALSQGLAAGVGVFKRVRWLLVFLFSSVAALATALGVEWPFFGQVASFAVTAFGFWFVPEALGRPTRWVAMRETRTSVHRIHPRLAMPKDIPDFNSGTWSAIDTLKQKLDGLGSDTGPVARTAAVHFSQ